MIMADKIIELRKKNGWSQEELAEHLGVSRQAVSKWEGALSVPDINKVIAMSSLFGVTTDYLLKDDAEAEETEETENADDENADAEEAEATNAPEDNGETEQPAEKAENAGDAD